MPPAYFGNSQPKKKDYGIGGNFGHYIRWPARADVTFMTVEFDSNAGQHWRLRPLVRDGW